MDSTVGLAACFIPLTFIGEMSQNHSKSATRALDSLSLINEEVITFQIKGHSPSGLRKLKSKKTVIKGLFHE